MSRSLSLAAVILLVPALFGLTACSDAVEDTRPGQPVKTRQKAFKEILRVFEPMGTMLRTNSYQPDKFAAYAHELIGKREAPWALFGPDTNYPPTKAKPAVWSEADRFDRERQAFFQASDELLVAAQSKKREDAEKAFNKVYDICQSCHQHFKEK